MSFQRDAALSSLYFISLQDFSTCSGCSLAYNPSLLYSKPLHFTIWLVPVVAHTVLRTPDEGHKEHPKHVEESCSEIKYRLLSAASLWKLIYIRLVMHGTMKVKFKLPNNSLNNNWHIFWQGNQTYSYTVAKIPNTLPLYQVIYIAVIAHYRANVSATCCTGNRAVPVYLSQCSELYHYSPTNIEVTLQLLRRSLCE
jgi:hypothetical protein